ncbi:MAG: transketolase [Patescibacteria group bacterium]
MDKKRGIDYLKFKASWIRKKILEMAVKSGGGHIAPSFSCVEILTALYYCGILNVDPKRPRWPGRDRFILSKGHAALALYAILADKGFFPRSKLMTFTQAGSSLGGHIENNVPGVEALSGSLGHGLCIAAGISLAAKMDQKKHFAIALLGDGECHEGAVWEAAMFASQQRLNNLVAIIDHNGLSATDFLNNYLKVEPLDGKWKSFGWEVRIIDGHSYREILSSFSDIRRRKSERPLAIIALTTKGKGISFMENKPIWHFRVPTGKELRMAREELF